MKITILNVNQLDDQQFTTLFTKLNSLRKSFMPDDWVSQWSDETHTYLADVEQYKNMIVSITVMVLKNELPL